MFEKIEIGNATLYHGDCLEIIPSLLSVDAVITDPPYPSYLTEEYGFDKDTINILDKMNCRQFVFWTPSQPFPLNYGGKRIWDKAVGTNTQFEEIYERNAGSGYKVHRHYIINSTVAASFTKDTFTGHPSQKPIALIARLVNEFPEGCIICDPFMGSGTTGVATCESGRKFIGIERQRKWFDISCERIEQAQRQMCLYR